MSHIVKIKCDIRDLGALRAAARRLGGEAVDVEEYVFYANQRARCTAGVALRFPNAAYEVGVNLKTDGTPGYDLGWDDFSEGGLVPIVGEGAGRLLQAYAIEAARNAAILDGYTVTESQQADGSVVLNVLTGN